MTRVIDSILEEWISTRLEPLFIDCNKAVDIDKEMTHLTTDVISRVGFDYKLSSEERISFVNDIRFVLDVNLRSRSNPIKRNKWLGLLFSDIRQAKKVTRRILDFGRKMLRQSRLRQKDPDENVDKNNLAFLLCNDSNYASDEQRVRDILLFL